MEAPGGYKEAAVTKCGGSEGYEGQSSYSAIELKQERSSSTPHAYRPRHHSANPHRTGYASTLWLCRDAHGDQVSKQ